MEGLKEAVIKDEIGLNAMSSLSVENDQLRHRQNVPYGPGTASVARMSAAISGVHLVPRMSLLIRATCWRWFGNLPAVDRSKTFAGSSACARSKVEQHFAASEESNVR